MTARKPFLKLVAEDLFQKFGSNLENIAIVFNNKRPITYFKKHLADIYQQAIWSPQFFTVQEFFKQSSSTTDASPLSQFFILFTLHNQLLNEEGRAPESLEDFYPIAEIILSDFAQLDYELCNIDHIFTELHESTSIDLQFQYLSEEQQMYIQKFWQSFSNEGHTGVQKKFLRLWRRLPILYRRFKDEMRHKNLTNAPTLYRNLAEDQKVASQFIMRYEKVLFVGFNALTRAETTLFSQWQTQGKALFYFDVDIHYLDDSLQEAGLFVRRNIQDSKLVNALPTANVIGQRKDEIHLYASNGNISQTKNLHKLLCQHSKNEETAAVILADETLLVPLMQSLPDIEVNITMGYPLTQSAIYALIDLWISVHHQISHLYKYKIPYHLVEDYINHPLVQLSKDERDSFLKINAENQLFEIEWQNLSFPSSALPQFFRPIDLKIGVIPTLIHMVDSLLQSYTDKQRLTQINHYLLIEVRKTLNQLHMGIEELQPVSTAFQFGLIKKALANVSSVIEGDPLKGLQIMGLLESRSLNFDHIYIIGANEGILPKTSSSPTFLPNNLRRAFGLPVLVNQDALSAYLFYRQFQYSAHIHVFYNSLINENSSGERSRFLMQLEFETEMNFIHHMQQQPIVFPGAHDKLIIPKKEIIWDALYDKYILKKQGISATALTTYLQSPLRFFLKHVVGIKEPPAIQQEFEMNKLGVIIHEVMEHIYQPFLQRKGFISTDELKRVFATIEKLTAIEIAKLYKLPTAELSSFNSLQHIMLRIAGEYIRMYVQYDIDHLRSFRIIELENEDDYYLDFPIQVKGQTETVRLYGIIDRVDEVITKEGIQKRRIVDYKTGADLVKYKGISNDDGMLAVDNKALIQTLFYTHVYEKVSGITELEPNLYVARKMREDGVLFCNRYGELAGSFLEETKSAFEKSLRFTLEEIFNAEIPFLHHDEMLIYDSDPYQLFYATGMSSDETEK